MDAVHNSVVYIDARAREAREFTRNSPPQTKSAVEGIPPSELLSTLTPGEEANENIHCLLRTFSRVFVHRDNDASIQFLKSIDYFAGSQTCTLVFIHTALDKEDDSKTMGPEKQDNEEQLLSQVAALTKSGSVHSTLLPVALVPGPSLRKTSRTWTESKRSIGVLDVLSSPLTTPLPANYVEGLVMQAQNDARKFKQERYSNMTKDLVERLLDDLCNKHTLAHNLGSRTSGIAPARQQAIVEAFSRWSFSAHDFTDDELSYGVYRILQHALRQPDLEQWNMSNDDMFEYLSATQIAYNNSVIYHNFHHACDVLQAVFHFLVSIGAIPPLVADCTVKPPVASGLGKLIRPVDALTLIIAAIGHDVGHPGVNNLFLVKVKAAVAQLYNDHSVLESYHCAASARILGRYWPAAYCDTAMRKLMISSILATDMTLHSQYTARLDALRQLWTESGNEMGNLDVKTQEEHRELICCLLIKSADICNVARTFDVAKAWAILVTEEFAHQGELEKDAEIPSCLFGGPPARGNITDLAKRQMGFINAFALDLFKKMTAILPEMQFTVDQINNNKERWQQTLEGENEKQAGVPFDLPTDGRRGSQVPPAQPQEVPKNNARTQEMPARQPQAVRPSVPMDMPHDTSSTSGDSPEEATASDEKQQAQSVRPSSSGNNTHGSSFPRYTTYSGSAPGTSPFNQPSPRSFQDSSSRRKSPAGATSSPKLAHVTKEPRRSSLGNINLAAPTESQEVGSRRSSGTSYYSLGPTLYQSMFNSRMISASQLRVDGPSDSPARVDAASIHSRPFSFSSGEDELGVAPLNISPEGSPPEPNPPWVHSVGDDMELSHALQASLVRPRTPPVQHFLNSSRGEIISALRRRGCEVPIDEQGRILWDEAIYVAGIDDPSAQEELPNSMDGTVQRLVHATEARLESNGAPYHTTDTAQDLVSVARNGMDEDDLYYDPFLSSPFLSAFPLDSRPTTANAPYVSRYGLGIDLNSTDDATVAYASALGEDVHYSGALRPPLAAITFQRHNEQDFITYPPPVFDLGQGNSDPDAITPVAPAVLAAGSSHGDEEPDVIGPAPLPADQIPVVRQEIPRFNEVSYADPGRFLHSPPLDPLTQDIPLLGFLSMLQNPPSRDNAGVLPVPPLPSLTTSQRQFPRQSQNYRVSPITPVSVDSEHAPRSTLPIVPDNASGSNTRTPSTMPIMNTDGSPHTPSPTTSATPSSRRQRVRQSMSRLFGSVRDKVT